MTRIIIRSGGVCIQYKHDSIINLLQPLMDRLTEVQYLKNWKTKQTEKSIKAKFYIHHIKQRTILFHSVFEEEVLKLLREHPEARHFKVDKQDIVEPTRVSIKYTSHKLPRGRQPEYIDFMCDIDNHIRILPAPPGVGKTLCTINAMTRLGLKTAIILQPSLKDNWVDNLKELTDLTDDDILYVSGGDGLHDYMRHINDGTDEWKVVIFSINTLQGYITGFMDDDLGWLYTPDELFDEAKFGLKVVDEAHKWLNFHMLLDMYSNIKVHHFLTGTLMNESKFIGDMEDTLFHESNRCEVDPPTSHLQLKAYEYRYFDKPPAHQGAMGYNHMKLESTIFKKTKQCSKYLRMIAKILYKDFYMTRTGNDRAVIFFATVNMVKAFTELLSDVLKDINTVSYLAGDDESKYDDAQIIVTTTKKAGTGTDFDNLTYLLHTIMISSIGENYQNALRLRKLNDRETTFAYIWSSSIPKHKGYHEKRLKDLKPLVASSKLINIGRQV